MWWLPVALRVGTADIGCAYFLKKVAGIKPRPLLIFLMFFFCLVLSIGFSLIVGHAVVSKAMFIPIGMGLANGVGVYCMWRAVHISLSKNSLFTVWDDIIAITLATIFLGDAQYISAGIGVGMLLSFAALGCFIVRSYTRGKEAKGHTPPIFFFFVAGYSCIWGISLFLNRWLSMNEILESGSYVTAWYSGSLITATILILLGVEREKGAPLVSIKNLSRRDFFMLVMLSLTVMSSQALMFISYGVAPLTVVQPIFFVTEMVVRSMVGLFIFNEAKEYDRGDWLCFTLAVFGGLIIAISFSN